jgi:hypothetical protein
MSRQRFLRLFAQRVLPTGLFGGAIATTKLDYWTHDPKDFDVYIINPTSDDLPYLLHKFDVEGLDVWPWIWTRPNDDGPHYVFIGVTPYVVQNIREIRAASPQNNILIVASEESLKVAAGDDPGVYARCLCGIVTDSKLQLLNHEAKILMLQDERVVAFDYLTIS